MDIKQMTKSVVSVDPGGVNNNTMVWKNEKMYLNRRKIVYKRNISFKK
jgi:hypothetical protein